MHPSFPSITFPNHYTLVTGLYPASHGIVGNLFFDPALNDTFEYTNPKANNDPKWWSGGEPVWITAQKQGLKSAVFNWPGSEAPNKGKLPTWYEVYNKSVTAPQKLAKAIDWIGFFNC